MKPRSNPAPNPPNPVANPAANPAANRAAPGARAPSPTSGGDEVVMVVDVRDPRTGDPVRTSAAQGERVDAAVRAAHDVVRAHGGRTVALLGTRLVGSFPDGAVEAGLDAAVDLQRRSAAPAGGSSWACSIGLATGPDNQVAPAALDIPLVGGAVDRALLLAAWSSAGAVLADDRTIATAQRGHTYDVPPVEGGADRAPPDPGAADAPRPDPARGSSGDPTGPRSGPRWSLGANHVLVGHEREPVEYWELSFSFEEPAARDGRRSASGRVLAVPSRADVRERLDALDPARPVAASVTAPPRRADVRITTRSDPSRARAWSRGEVRCWFANRGRGVIGSSTTQEFYVDRRFLAVPAAIAQGDSVFFVPRDAVGGGRNPAASAVLVVGSEVEVRVDRVDPRGFGVAELRDPAGTRATLVVELGPSGALGVEPGDWLLVRIRAAEHGPVGEPV